MNDLVRIACRSAGLNLPFLLAGGHAVIIHGFPRSTFDLDLIVRRSDQQKWLKLAQELGYQMHREGPTFLQFNATEPAVLFLDLMLVNDRTFEKLFSDSISAPASIPGVRLVSLLHLLALKCHAIKHGRSGRIVNGADDVLRLIQNNRIDSANEGVRALLLKYEPKTYLKKSPGSAAQMNNSELEFPDWSGMDDSSVRITTEGALRLCEYYPALLGDKLEKLRDTDSSKCTVEFIL